MDAVEHRTSPPAEEEGEIVPFFEGGMADSFDVDAPNDRFGEAPAANDLVNDDAFSFGEAEAAPDERSSRGRLILVARASWGIGARPVAAPRSG